MVEKEDKFEKMETRWQLGSKYSEFAVARTDQAANAQICRFANSHLLPHHTIPSRLPCATSLKTTLVQSGSNDPLPQPDIDRDDTTEGERVDAGARAARQISPPSRLLLLS